MGRSPLLTSSTFSAHFCLAQYNKVFHIKKSSSSKIFYIHDCLRSWAIDYFWSEADWSRIDYAIVIIVVNDCGKKKKKAGKKSVVQNRNFQSRMGAPVGKPQNDGTHYYISMCVFSHMRSSAFLFSKQKTTLPQ